MHRSRSARPFLSKTALAAGLAALTPLVLIGAGAGFAPSDAATAHDPEPYLRVREIEETGGVHLQIALRTFQRGPEEPSLTLVGVAHIGEPAYYADLEERLDAHDLVLFEGVGPIWAETDEGMSDRDRVSATKSRIRLIGISAMQRRAAGDPVRTIEDTWAHASGYEARLVKASAADAWGNPLRFEATDSGFVIESLGADGAPGGRGADADLSLADLPPITGEEIEAGDGIQTQMAGAAGLVFQLTAMDYDKPHWVNSDTTAEALSYALAGMDPDDARPGGGMPQAGGGDPLFDLMSGRGMIGKIAGGLLKIIGASPQSRAMLRLMLIETLANADEMMDLAGGMEGDAGAGLSRMMEVLIDQRNAVVLEDIEAAIDGARRGDGPETIAIFYGAGHLGEMERSLVEMGYRPTETQWVDAIGVDPADTGMTREQISGMRRMMSRMIESQTDALRSMQQRD